jgi:Zn-finger nucleic acid-binding protein
MNANNDIYQRKVVRVEAPNCACGFVGHMTADELKQRAAHDEMDLSCPVCGLIHLSREEIEDLEKQKVVNSKRYREIVRQAIADV